MRKRFGRLALALTLLLAVGTAVPIAGYTAGAFTARAEIEYEIPDTWDTFCPDGHRELFGFENGEPAYVDGNGGEEIMDYRNSVIRQRSIDDADDYSVEATFTPEKNQTPDVERSYGLTVWYVNANNFLQFFMQHKAGSDVGSYSAVLYGYVEGQKRVYATTDSADKWNNPADDPINTGLEFADTWWDSGSYGGILNGRPGGTPDPSIKSKNLILNETVTLRAEVSNVRHTGTNERCKRFDLYVTCRTSDSDNTPVTKMIRQFWVKGTAEGDTMAGIYFNRMSFGVSNFAFWSDTAIADCEALIDGIPEASDAQFAQKAIAASLAFDALAETQNKVDPAKASALESAEALLPAALDRMIEALDPDSASFVNDVTNLRDTVGSLKASITEKITKISQLEAAETTVQRMSDAAEVVETIELIPSPVTLNAAAAVSAARAAYDALSAEAKTFVPAEKLAVLTAAESALADITAAAAVRNQILEIPSRVTAASKDMVERVRAAYDALTDAQKALITADELAMLTEAERQLAENGGSKGGCGSRLGVFGTASVAVVLAAVSGAFLLLLRRRRTEKRG